MYFGSEFFGFSGDFFVPFFDFFGGDVFEIPDNLFDVGFAGFVDYVDPAVPEVCGSQRTDIYENYFLGLDFDFVDFINSESAENYFPRNFYKNFFGREIFSDYFRGLNGFINSRGVTEIVNVFREFIERRSGDFYEGSGLRGGLGSLFTGLGSGCGYCDGGFFDNVFLSRELSRNFYNSDRVCGNYFGNPEIFLKFSEIVSRNTEKFFGYYGSNYERIDEIFDVLTGGEIDEICKINPIGAGFRADEKVLNYSPKTIPENIFSAAVSDEASKNIIRKKREKTELEISRICIDRRFDELSEIIRSIKKTDYEQVSRRLDSELRAALASCGEGARF